MIKDSGKGPLEQPGDSFFFFYVFFISEADLSGSHTRAVHH